ncbi:nucleolar GTP-binding protein 1-like protein [Tanacetum coccineum]
MELEDEKRATQKERDRLQAEIQNLSATSDGQTQKLQDLHSHKLKSLESQIQDLKKKKDSEFELEQLRKDFNELNKEVSKLRILEMLDRLLPKLKATDHESGPREDVTRIGFGGLSDASTLMLQLAQLVEMEVKHDAIRIKKSTAESRQIVPRKHYKEKQFTSERMGRQLSDLGLEPSKALDRVRSKSRGRKRERSSDHGGDEMDVDNDGSNKKLRLRSLSKSVGLRFNIAIIITFKLVPCRNLA